MLPTYIPLSAFRRYSSDKDTLSHTSVTQHAIRGVTWKISSTQKEPSLCEGGSTSQSILIV